MKVLAMPVAFNEEKKIGSVLDRFTPGLVDKIIVVDDGSTDGTPDEIRKRGIEVVTHKIRRGVGAAIRTGIRYAQQNGFDVLIVLAGNDKDRPAEIPELLKPIREGNCDFVQGSRYLNGNRGGNMPLYRRLATKLHPVLFSIACRRKVSDSTNGFRAIRLSIFNDARINIDQPWLDKYELEPYILFKAIRLGYQFAEVPVTKIYPSRELGYTKMKPLTGWWSILRPIFLLGLGIRR
jgi:dolichol-phosphate mannosyltransferase